MHEGRLLLRVGSLFLLAGVLMLAFVAYQLWGTALYEHGAQATLRSELHAILGREVVPQRPLGGSRTARTSAGLANRSPRSPTPTTPTREPRIITTTAPPTTTTTTAPVSVGKPRVETSIPGPLSREPLPVNAHATPDRYVGYVAPAEGDPATNTPIGYLSIPKIGLDDAIVEGVDEPQLQQGPGHYPGTPLPGESGNVAIAGHRTTYAAPFYNLNELVTGDPIYIQTAQGTFTYDVTQSFAVLPTDVSVLDATSQPTLTLTTCNPRYSAAQRLVVKANLVASQVPPGESTTTTTTTPNAAPSRPGPARLAGEQGLAGNGGGGSLTLAIVWGVITAALAAASVIIRRRRRLPRLVRRGAVVLGTPLALGSLFLFFSHVSTALPGSF